MSESRSVIGVDGLVEFGLYLDGLHTRSVSIHSLAGIAAQWNCSGDDRGRASQIPFHAAACHCRRNSSGDRVGRLRPIRGIRAKPEEPSASAIRQIRGFSRRKGHIRRSNCEERVKATGSINWAIDRG